MANKNHFKTNQKRFLPSPEEGFEMAEVEFALTDRAVFSISSRVR